MRAVARSACYCCSICDFGVRYGLSLGEQRMRVWRIFFLVRGSSPDAVANTRGTRNWLTHHINMQSLCSELISNPVQQRIMIACSAFVRIVSCTLIRACPGMLDCDLRRCNRQSYHHCHCRAHGRRRLGYATLLASISISDLWVQLAPSSQPPATTATKP